MDALIILLFIIKYNTNKVINAIIVSAFPLVDILMIKGLKSHIYWILIEIYLLSNFYKILFIKTEQPISDKENNILPKQSKNLNLLLKKCNYY